MNSQSDYGTYFYPPYICTGSTETCENRNLRCPSGTMCWLKYFEGKYKQGKDCQNSPMTLLNAVEQPLCIKCKLSSDWSLNFKLYLLIYWKLPTTFPMLCFEKFCFFQFNRNGILEHSHITAILIIIIKNN